LVSGQVAASLILLISAGLFLRSFQSRQSVDPGFGQNPTGLLQFVVSAERYDTDEGRVFSREYLDRMAELPGVTAVGLISNIHLNTTSTQTLDLNVDGVEPPPGTPSWGVDQAIVTPEFFKAAGISILRGRNFQNTDEVGAPRVAIINDAMAQRFWPDGNALGKVVRRESGEELEIVGISATTKVRTLGEPPRPFIYRPYTQNYVSYLTAVIQTTGRAEDPLRAGFRLLREMDPEILVVETKTMEEHLGIMLFPARLGALLAMVFAVVALALASIGLYGVVSYAVARRSREMGIRMSLGARPGVVVSHVVRGGMGLVGVGAFVGLGLSLAGVRVVRSFLFGVNPMDPATFLAVPGVLLVVTLLAAYLPARRASRVDPVRALKAE
jgi:predicted permease